jgi:alkaline phosphatase D
VARVAGTPAQVSLWIEWRAQGATGAPRRTPVQPVDQTADWAAQFALDDLEPGTIYEYQRTGRSDDAPGMPRPPSCAPRRCGPGGPTRPRFGVLAGSCAYTNHPEDDRPGRPYGGGESIFATMAGLKPDLTLWMGDNVYLRETDFGDMASSSRRYARWRETPELQALLRTGSHLATWDDHDYGPNDSNAAWVHKADSLSLFKRYWANPSYGLPGSRASSPRHSSRMSSSSCSTTAGTGTATSRRSRTR